MQIQQQSSWAITTLTVSSQRNTSSDELVMFPEWKTMAFQRSSCTANSPLAIVRKGLQRRASRTTWRSRPPPRTWAVAWPCCWPCGLVPHSISSCCPVQSRQETHSKTRDRGRRPAPPPPPHQTLHFLADTARDPVSPALVWSATSVPAVNDNMEKTINLCSQSQEMMMIHVDEF